MPAGQDEGARVDLGCDAAAGVPSSGVESLGVTEGSAVEDAGEAAVPAAACLVDAEMERALNVVGRVIEAWRRPEARRRQVLQIMVVWQSTVRRRIRGRSCRLARGSEV